MRLIIGLPGPFSVAFGGGRRESRAQRRAGLAAAKNQRAERRERIRAQRSTRAYAKKLRAEGILK